MELIFVLASAVTAVAGLKCHTTVDLVIRWTVDCSAMNLSTAPPPMIIHPVVTLNMSHNAFVHLRVNEFINWTDVSMLDLSSNSIQTIHADSFKGMSNLTELYLTNNSIEVLSQNITIHLQKLKVLKISSNKLKLIASSAFDPVPLLYKLYLGNNVDLGKDLVNYNALRIPLNKNLITFGFENVSLTEIPERFFSEASHLIYLNLAFNPLRNISDLPGSLRYLNISGTLIDSISEKSFSKLQLIQKLSLESMPKLKEIKKNSFSGLTNLEELYIRNCPNLNVISEDAFAESHPKLRKVVLSQCALSTLPKTFKTSFSEVEHLDLQGNPWICDGSVSWIVNMNIISNLTADLRCDKPLPSQGMLMVDYFKPRSLHPYSSLIRAGIVVVLVAVLVASVVGMVKQMSKEKAKTYRHLEDIRLNERTPRALPSL